MGLLNDIKQNQRNSDLNKQLAEYEKATRVIPDDIACYIADYIYNYMLERIKSFTTERRYATHEKSLILGIIKKSYYCVHLDARSLIIGTDRGPAKYYPGNMFPPNEYLGYMEHDYGPDEIICDNIAVLKEVFSKVIIKFEKEGIKSVLDIYKDGTRMKYYVIIPCDKNGNVL